MAYIISRFQEGISLNPREFVLDENDELMKFETYDEAKEFLLEAGIDESEIDNGVYIDEEEEV
jgi:hypothetical protein